MIAAGADLKIYIATRPIDFRCGHDGLAAKVQDMLRLDPFSGAAFVFRSKRADRIKILVWDRTGLVLVHKRLEGCKFVWPTIADGVMPDVAGDVRGLVRGAGLEVGPSGRSTAAAGGGITAAE
ncbi:IS66 family insertion sequence element accessory protein TnpB [Bradyrhizobium sp. CCBAU 45394]|uniref:IS66 family insertion sequence element accessory protein TnpB n=1 Tax=Bradyrhizobium sp. CCBAU 45394 TaxID=1325087 RepID=UPI0023026D23|nr:IS66 family insertion sequence element accessory protein TnpB [Bradyrhizobium sp. CCBAU 45394]